MYLSTHNAREILPREKVVDIATALLVRLHSVYTGIIKVHDSWCLRCSCLHCLGHQELMVWKLTLQTIMFHRPKILSKEKSVDVTRAFLVCLHSVYTGIIKVHDSWCLRCLCLHCLGHQQLMVWKLTLHECSTSMFVAPEFLLYIDSACHLMPWTCCNVVHTSWRGSC